PKARQCAMTPRQAAHERVRTVLSRCHEERPGLDVRVDAVEPETRVRPFDDRPAETLRVSEFECAALERDVAGGECHRPDQYEAANPDDHPDDEPRESRRHRRRIADEELVTTRSVLRTGILPHVRPSGRGP